MKTSIALFGIACLIAPAYAAETPAVPPPAKHFKIIQPNQAHYPVRMLNEGVTHGMARVVLYVNSQGQLVDCLPVAYTRKAFATEAVQTIQKWKFEPEYVNGEPIDTILTISLNFEVNGVLLVQRYGSDPQFDDMLNGYEYQACSLKNLDRIPAPLNIVNPTYPLEWAAKGITGKVAVDFYIDETGKVRFVAPLAGAHELLTGIAVAAVNKWQFAPPTRNGKPVLVHARQIFDFNKDTVEAK
jgi:TonB family protein